MRDKNSHNETFEELCAGYVLDALSDEDRLEFEAMLDNAGESEQKLYQELKAAANQLAFAADAQAPSPAVKQRLMQQIQPDNSVTAKDERPHSNRYTMAMAACFALFIITVALGFYAININGDLNNKETLIAQQKATIVELKNKVQHREELLSILSARTVDLVVMTGMEVNANGYGKIIWDPEKNQALLQVSNLPAEPEGMDYQLWLIKNNKPMPAGVFSVNATDEASFFKVQEMPDVTMNATSAFAVTLEPEGGMAQPTGDMYLMGSAE